MNLDEAKKRISQLEEALMLMVYQYCVTDDRLEHRYMCAGEHAVAALGLENGDSVDKLEEMLKFNMGWSGDPGPPALGKFPG